MKAEPGTRDGLGFPDPVRGIRLPKPLPVSPCPSGAHPLEEGPEAFFRVFPTSIGLDSLGNLYVLDAGNYRISVFDRSGRHLAVLRAERTRTGRVGVPLGPGSRPRR
jgi:hypothetical protein